MTNNDPPLTGVRVLDMGAHPASALASMVLADFGARVTAVAPETGAIATHPAAPMLLRGKHVMPRAQGREFERALTEADVLITTLGPDDAVPLLGERQIHLNISGWGLQGPYARYAMRESLVAARSGRMLSFAMQNGRAGPGYAAVQIGTLAASQLGVQGILAALLTRDENGRGQRIDTSLLQGMMPHDFYGLALAQFESRFPEQLPPQPAVAKPPMLGYQPVQAQDGRWLQLGNLFDHLFNAYLDIAGLSDLPPEHERGKLNATWSPESQDKVRDGMLARMRARPAAEWRAAFDAHGNVAAAPFQSTQEALDDPDMVVPGDVIDSAHPLLGTVRWLGPLAHFEATPARIVAAPAIHATRATLAGGPSPDPFATPPERRSAIARPTARDARQAGDAPLRGVTVLEFASVVATPLAVAGLADLGARVIKIEPIGGDPGRWMAGSMAQHLIALKPNAGKESICIELKSPQGREILDRLLPMADLIAHNFRPGVPDRLGFGYERARQFNPRVVWLSANGYHPDAPGASRPCAHPIAGAQCGGALFQAGAGMPPAATDDLDVLRAASQSLWRANEGSPDPNTSMVIGTAALLGLFAARRLGVGQQINIDMMQANLYANFDDALRYEGKPPRARVDADLYGLHALHRLYRCREGWIFLDVEDDAEFLRLCTEAGLAPVAGDARFGNHAARRANDGALAERLSAMFLADRAGAWESRLNRVAVGCVQADACETGEFWYRDPHVHANGLVVPRDHRRYGPYLRHGPLMRFSESTMRCEAGSLAGDHTDSLLAELGYGEDEIAALRADKVVWSDSLQRLAY